MFKTASTSTFLASVMLIAIAMSNMSTATSKPPGKEAYAETDIVDCILPGKVKQIGRRIVQVAPRRKIQTTASTCRIRGGTVVS